MSDLRQLRDLHDALGNPWWPLAPGWWLLLLAALGALLLLWRWRNRAPWLRLPLLRSGDWRWEAARELGRLRRRAADASLKARAEALSELLRRIAIARHGRSACAGLHGSDWLQWLSAHDPAGFDWRHEGDLLLTLPYAPDAPADAARERQLARLIKATERWIRIRRSDRVRRRAGTRQRRRLQ